MRQLVCPECGKTFEPEYGSQVCCSTACKKTRRLKSNRASGRRLRGREKYDWWHATAPVPLHTLQTAQTKPQNCSDVRWRMELRRRANPGLYDLMAPPTNH